MSRSSIVLPSGGKIIVRGTVRDVADRLRGSATDWIEFSNVMWDARKGDWLLKPVLVNRLHVVAVVEAS